MENTPMFTQFRKMVRETLTDSRSGKYSHAKVIAMLVAVAATVFIWKLILMGGMGIDYFIAYLAYGTGHQSLNKFLDSRVGKNDADSGDDAPKKGVH